MDETETIMLIPIETVVMDDVNSEVQQQINEPTSTWDTRKRKRITHFPQVPKRKI